MSRAGGRWRVGGGAAGYHSTRRGGRPGASAAWQRAARELSPSARVVHAVEIRHPDLAAPLRLVNDVRDLDGTALFASEARPPYVNGDVYVFNHDRALPESLFSDAMGDPFFSAVDVRTTGDVASNLIFRDDQSGDYPAGPHLAIPASRLVVVLQVGDQTWGVPLDPGDTSEPYRLATPLPAHLLTALRAEIAQSAPNRLRQRVALVDRETWIFGDDWPRAFEGGRYTAVPFALRLADDSQEQAPRAELRLDNVGRIVTAPIAATSGGEGATVTVSEVLVADGQASVEWTQTIGVGGVTIDDRSVVLRLGFERMIGRPAVHVRHDPSTSPGLF